MGDVALCGEPRLNCANEAWRLEKRAHGASLRPRQRRPSRAVDRGAALDKICTIGAIRSKTVNTQKNLEDPRRDLGKGEVVSSILTGSTINTPGSIDFFEDSTLSTRQLTHERRENIGGRLV